jgi:hypothetical protein
MTPGDILEIVVPEVRVTLLVVAAWVLWRIDRRLLAIEHKLGIREA